MKVTVETKEKDVPVGFGDVIQLEACSGKQHYLLTRNTSNDCDEILLVNLESGYIWADGIKLRPEEIWDFSEKRYSFIKLVNNFNSLSEYSPKVVTAEVTIK